MVIIRNEQSDWFDVISVSLTMVDPAWVNAPLFVEGLQLSALNEL